MPSIIVSAIVVAGLALAATLAPPPPEAAASKSCGKITIKYSYGSYEFKVWVYEGSVRCAKARKVMKQGIPANKPDPPGWACLQGPAGASFSDVCKAGNPRRVVRARVLL